MNTNPTPKWPNADRPIKPLDRDPSPSKSFGEPLEERAAEPPAIEVAPGLACAGRIPPTPPAEPAPVVEAECLSELSIANRALEKEVRGRHVLEHKLALVTEQKDAARHAAFHDSLTGLPNRALFMDRLDHGLALARRHRWTLAVMFLDLDGFKQINDSYGHDAGDRVLVTIARRLEKNARDDDTVSRFGGDEFLYLLMEVGDAQNLASIARMIVKEVQEPCAIQVRDLAILAQINASLGIAVFPQHGSTSEGMIARADEAMYRAKREGTGFAFARP